MSKSKQCNAHRLYSEHVLVYLLSIPKLDIGSIGSQSHVTYCHCYLTIEHDVQSNTFYSLYNTVLGQYLVIPGNTSVAMFSFAVFTILVFGIFKGKFMQELLLTVNNF